MRMQPIPIGDKEFTFNWINWLETIQKYIVNLLYPVRGNMYVKAGTINTTISVSNTAYLVSSGFSIGTSKGMELVNSSTLQIQKNGVYLINWNSSVYTNTSGDNIESGIMVDGAEQSSGSALGTSGTTNPINLSSSSILTLNAGQLVGIYVKNKTNTNTVTLKNGSLTLTYIGIS